MKRIEKCIYCFLIINLFSLSIIHAQQDEVLNKTQKIMKDMLQVYDSVPYLNFEVNYEYGPDSSLVGNEKSYKMSGKYQMFGRKAKFNIDQIEYMQNDSFFIAIHKKQKLIIISKPRESSAGKNLPMRGLLDSMMTVYSKHYRIRIDENERVGSISFFKADSMAQFDSFLIGYNVQNHYITLLQYHYHQQVFAKPVGGDTGVDITDKNTVISKSKYMKVHFENYRIDNSDPDIFYSKYYIRIENGKYKPAEKYSDYKLYNSIVR